MLPSGTRTFLSSSHNRAQETKKPDQAIAKEEAESGAAEAIVTSQSDDIIPPETISASNETKAETPPPAEKNEAPETRETPPQDTHNTSNSESQDNPPPVEVVIVSPKGASTAATDGLKRTIPQPATEPPSKRKRGRPRKVKPIESEPETVEAAEPEPGFKVPGNNYIEPNDSLPVPPVRETNEPQPPSQPANTNEGDMQTITNEQNRAAGSPLSEVPEDLTPPPSQPTANETEKDLDTTEKSPTKSDEPPTISAADEIILSNIPSPNMLVTKILQIDGRPKEGQRAANPWKEIRCYRKNQDMGSLWDVRQAWYFKQNPE